MPDVEISSGTKEQVAFDLMKYIRQHSREDFNEKTTLLALYKECLNATYNIQAVR